MEVDLWVLALNALVQFFLWVAGYILYLSVRCIWRRARGGSATGTGSSSAAGGSAAGGGSSATVTGGSAAAGGSSAATGGSLVTTGNGSSGSSALATVDTDCLKDIESKLSILCYVDYNYRFKGM